MTQPPIPKVERSLLEKAIDDEVEAIEFYQKLLDSTDDPKAKKIYRMIQDQERHHKKMLEGIK